MQATLNIELKTQDLLALFKQLEPRERISIFKEFSDEWLMYLGISKVEPFTLEQYNQKLQQGISDFSQGNTLTHSQIKTEIEAWKMQKK